jgi:hypothetical protein
MQQAPIYTTIDEAWGDSKPQTVNDILALNPNFDERSFFRSRTQIETIQERHDDKHHHDDGPNHLAIRQAYQTILEHKDDGVPADKPSTTSSETSSSSNNHGDDTVLFPMDIFGFAPDENSFQVAHLIPNGFKAIRSYWFVVPFLFNTPSAYYDNDNNIQVNAADDIWTSVQCSRFLNGTCCGHNNNETRRIDNTGVKHLNINKIGLKGQKDRYDIKPEMIIVPILTPEQMRDWQGGGYSAIVLAGYDKGLMGVNPRLPPALHNTAIEYETYLAFSDGETATADEVNTATHLLQTMIKAIFMVKHRHCPHGIPNDEMYFPHEIVLPMFLNPNNLHVAKTVFSNPNVAGQHAAPDPVLLTVKAAVNWSKRHAAGMQLAAKAEPKHEEWMDDEGHQIAAEEYEEWAQSLIRPPNNFHDLAAGLGQPDAVRPDDWGLEDDTTTSSTSRRNRGGPPMPDVRALLGWDEEV